MTAVVLYTVWVVGAYAFTFPKLVKSGEDGIFTKGRQRDLFLGMLFITLPLVIFVVASVGWGLATVALCLYQALSYGRAAYEISEYGGTLARLKTAWPWMISQAAIIVGLFIAAS
jgi:hypothetical protein